MLHSLFKGQVLFVIPGSRNIPRWLLIFPNSLRSCLPPHSAEVGFCAPHTPDVFLFLFFMITAQLIAYCFLSSHVIPINGFTWINLSVSLKLTLISFSDNCWVTTWDILCAVWKQAQLSFHPMFHWRGQRMFWIQLCELHWEDLYVNSFGLSPYKEGPGVRVWFQLYFLQLKPQV